MSERTRKIGILDSHMKKALILVRDLRIAAMEEQLDPRAVRIALIYAMLTDNHASRRVLTVSEDIALQLAAKEFFEKARPRT